MYGTINLKLPDMFPVTNGWKQEDAPLPLFFKICFRYAIRRVQDCLKGCGTYQLLVYADDFNILRECVHTMKENAAALLMTSKETGREVNADKTKYMVMS
jgi:hypothetical protein